LLKVVSEWADASPDLPAGVGGTPLVEVDGIIVKLECVNPCGSVKDRIVAYILKKAQESGALQPGQKIIEATSGNTGIALAYYGRLMGHPVTIVMPEHMTEERKALIRHFGAELVLCSQEGSFAEAASIRDALSEELGAYNPDQFSNALNAECHRETTGREILSQLGANLKGRIAFVAGVGTGGTLVGVAAALKEKSTEVTAIAVEPKEAAVMTGGENRTHGIFGIGDGFVPALAQAEDGSLNPLIDEVEVISTEEAMDAARELNSKFSLCVGVSSGANFVASRRVRERFDRVITVFADGHQKYHSAGLGQSVNDLCPFLPICTQSTLEKSLRDLNIGNA